MSFTSIARCTDDPPQQAVEKGPPTLAAYKRHAELFGPAEVLETAEEHLFPRHLAQLASYLRDLRPHRVRDSHGRLVIDRDWSQFRMSRKTRDHLIVSLIESGEPDRFIADKLGVGRGKVAQIRGGIDPKTGPNPPQPRGGVNPNRETWVTGLCLQCGAPYAQAKGRGRPQKYCSTECRRAVEFALRRASVGNFPIQGETTK
jgi:hypothetical protein